MPTDLTVQVTAPRRSSFLGGVCSPSYEDVPKPSSPEDASGFLAMCREIRRRQEEEREAAKIEQASREQERARVRIEKHFKEYFGVDIALASDLPRPVDHNHSDDHDGCWEFAIFGMTFRHQGIGFLLGVQCPRCHKTGWHYCTSPVTLVGLLDGEPCCSDCLTAPAAMAGEETIRGPELRLMNALRETVRESARITAHDVMTGNA